MNRMKGLEFNLINDGTAYEVSMSNGEGIVKIPSTYNGLPVIRIAECGFLGKHLIKKVYIPDSVTSVGNYAFSCCNNLTGVEIPSSVQEIPNGMFFGCGRLSNVKISYGVKSIGVGAFHGCTNLENIEIPLSVTSIAEYAFRSCRLKYFAYGSNEIFYVNNETITLEGNRYVQSGIRIA